MTVAQETNISAGYKQTEVGTIPVDWNVIKLGNCLELLTDFEANGSFEDIAKNVHVTDSENYAWYVRATDLENKTPLSDVRDVDKASYDFLKKTCLYGGEVLITKRGEIGKVYLFQEKGIRATLGPNLYLLKLNRKVYAPYVFLYFRYGTGNLALKKNDASTTLGALYKDDVKAILLPLPTVDEQETIATTLLDLEALIEALETLITKKRAIKQGAMQVLLTGKRRLPGFSGKWEVKTIEEATDCLDNLRIPLNETQRSQMPGDIPYCGANGVLDYVNNYVVDDDIILIAEDGGYFDEYESRPIAYRMIGKCWVNNHAHILKAKGDFDQAFVFYSLVHKNILKFLASGTRAKLNKSEMYKIEFDTPPTKDEQAAIANVLSEMDAEIAAIEQKLAKYKALKQGMMRVLLTGKIRLPH
jgi:type I restriction enzyme S subunit